VVIVLEIIKPSRRKQPSGTLVRMIRARRPRNDRPPVRCSLTCDGSRVRPVLRSSEYLRACRSQFALVQRSLIKAQAMPVIPPITWLLWTHPKKRRRNAQYKLPRTFGCRIGWRGVGGGGDSDGPRRVRLRYAPCVHEPRIIVYYSS
ncbi:unnamed protein product, partial [Trichogramma brassicae]